MKHRDDPTGLTEWSDAPESLREAFGAARDDFPRPGELAELGRSIASAIGGPPGGGTPQPAGGAAPASAGAGGAAAGGVLKPILLALAGGALLVGGAIYLSGQPRSAEVAAPAPAATIAAASPPATPDQPAEPVRAAIGNPVPGAVPADPAPTPAEAAETVELPAPAQPSTATSGRTERVAGGAPRRSVAAPDRAEAASESPAASEPSSAPRSPEPAVEQAPPKRSVSEAALLDQARAALKSDPKRALALADEHRRRFPRGLLAEEREVIAIQALKRLGDQSGARGRARDFRERHPDSIHERKVDEAAGKP